MAYYFTKPFDGPPFELFQSTHLLALGVVGVVVLVLFFLRWCKSRRLNTAFRWSLAILLALQELSYHAWKISIDEWTLQSMLPFHLCSAFVWLSAFMLATRNRTIADFAFFIGISSALQALCTPDIGDYGFPHYRFFQVFISHGAILIAALYMTIVEGCRPTWRSLGKAFVGVNIYAGCVFCINLAIGSNYMFVVHKPETASLFDVLGPWPVYIFAAQGIALLMFLLLYLPFAIHNRCVSSATTSIHR